MKNWKHALLLCGVVMMVPGISSAEPQMDLNAEMAKIQDKLSEASNNEFKQMDTDADGKVSHEEYTNYVVAETTKKADNSFKQLDQDKDGKISKTEYDEFMNFATGKMNEFVKAMQAQQKK